MLHAPEIPVYIDLGQYKSNLVLYELNQTWHLGFFAGLYHWRHPEKAAIERLNSAKPQNFLSLQKFDQDRGHSLPEQLAPRSSLFLPNLSLIPLALFVKLTHPSLNLSTHL